MSEVPLSTDMIDYLKLTRRQTGATDWTSADREGLQELERSLGINQPDLTAQQTDALHRQGIAGIRLGTGQAPQPALTNKERGLIIGVNAPSSKSST
jgi:hypothetical protein